MRYKYNHNATISNSLCHYKELIQTAFHKSRNIIIHFFDSKTHLYINSKEAAEDAKVIALSPKTLMATNIYIFVRYATKDSKESKTYNNT
ncbi:hypothetical protein P8452_64291 [Trifolium repens]|nr:hypothetical protein P8452_64291 [Trifolium repens]